MGDLRDIDLCTCGHGRGRHLVRPDIGGMWCDCGCPTFVPHPQPRQNDRTQRLTVLRQHRANYIQYARDRIEDEDWHGVSDAANDLRELDVEIRMLEDEGG